MCVFAGYYLHYYFIIFLKEKSVIVFKILYIYIYIVYILLFFFSFEYSK